MKWCERSGTLTIHWLKTMFHSLLSPEERGATVRQLKELHTQGQLQCLAQGQHVAKDSVQLSPTGEFVHVRMTYFYCKNENCFFKKKKTDFFCDCLKKISWSWLCGSWKCCAARIHTIVFLFLSSGNKTTSASFIIYQLYISKRSAHSGR